MRKGPFPLYDKTRTRLIRSITAEEADQLVMFGDAQWCNGARAVRLIHVNLAFMRRVLVPLSCGQEQAYEALGIEKYPQIVQGGLTRTEHQPSPLTIRVQPLRHGRMPADEQPEIQP